MPLLQKLKKNQCQCQVGTSVNVKSPPEVWDARGWGVGGGG